MLHHLVRNGQVVAILEKCETWNASTVEPAERDVRFNVRDCTAFSFLCLKDDRVEVRSDTVSESSLSAFRCGAGKSIPVTAKIRVKYPSRCCGYEIGLLSGHPCDTGLGSRLIHVIQDGHDIFCHASRRPVRHVVREVVHMKEPVYEVAGDTRLLERGSGIAHRDELSSSESWESELPLRAESSATKKPFFGFSGCLVLMLVVVKRKAAVGHEVGDHDLERHDD